MTAVLKQFYEFIERLDGAPSDHKFLLAYSGGLDSRVLLDILWRVSFELQFSVRVVHINHGLQAAADEWALTARCVCSEYGLEYLERKLSLTLQVGDSLEEIAREQRYAVFSELLQPNEILLTAHHQNDQAETMLLQLMRGAGVKGLAAMPLIKSFGVGFLARPLLKMKRDELEQYAMEHDLEWIEDDSNQDRRLMRNFIRHEILAKMRQRLPNVVTTIARSAQHCAEMQNIADEEAEKWCTSIAGNRENSLNLAKFIQFNPARQRLILRAWIHKLGMPLPSVAKLNNIIYDLLPAARDRVPCVTWANVEVRRFDNELILQTARQVFINSQDTFGWCLDQHNILALPGNGCLRAVPVLGRGLRADVHEVRVGYRQGGEKIELRGIGRKQLKTLLQEWRIPPWERYRIPLLYFDGKIIAIPGYFLHVDFVAQKNCAGRELFFELN